MSQHPFYEPTNEFIERHNLTINEAETWVELAENVSRPKRELHFNKETGLIILFLADNGHINYHEYHVFTGYLPDEAALEAVIKYTRWLEG